MVQNILVSVAWPYANGPRHIGHVAGFGVPSDIFARYHRLAGNRVLMVSGTDEHGTPITVQADKEGVTPKTLVDRYNGIITEDLMKLGLSYDLFTRTTTLNHSVITQDLFKTLFEKGYIIKKYMMGAFSARTGHTLPDRFLEGTCPHCAFEEARGDQCDNCGKQLDPEELINPRSKVDGEPPVFRESEHFFLDLSAFVDPLRRWINDQEHWRSNVRRFSLNLLEDLQPRAITRDLEWGITIPLPEYEDRSDKKIYVWFDAVTGYLSASVEWADYVGQPDAWREWWQNPEARHYYFMGKDNIVFHSVIWPSMLIGYGNGLPGSLGTGEGEPLGIPFDVVSSEFLTMEGRKFSSSRGVVIYVKDFLDRYDPDALRFYLTIAGPESQDTDFTWAEFVRRNNDELVATWGNLVNRVMSMTNKAFGKVPPNDKLQPADRETIEKVELAFGSIGDLIEKCSFKAALAECLLTADLVNRYLNDTEPWQLVKTDMERAGAVLYTALQCIDNLKVLLAPFLPFSCQRLHQMLGYQGSLSGELRFDEHQEKNGDSHRVLTGDYHKRVGTWRPTALPPGQALQDPQPLFKKLDDSVVTEELARMETRVAE
ncbi:MAG: methionine--tRNA ligase [Deltaproteobacteria bacterium]|nr:methionine--tRNA ligase [Deltaproteobacteria bacterium]